MSMKPGATIWPRASITRVAARVVRGSMATTRPSRTLTSASRAGVPVPSTTWPPRMRRSSITSRDASLVHDDASLHLAPGGLLRHDGDGGDRARADEPGGLNRVATDAATAPHRHARARRDLGAIEDGARAREHAARDEAPDVERRVLADGDDAFLHE